MTGGWLDPGPYRLGLEMGRRYAAHRTDDMEPGLKLEVALVGTSNRYARARALGELRGYRQAAGLPDTLYGHRVTP